MAAAHSEAFLTTVASTLRDVTCDVFRLCGKNVYNYDVELLGCVSDRGTFRVHSVRGITGRERENRAGTVLRSHFDGVCRCVFGAGGLSALWQRVGGTAAPGAVCGANAGG